MFALLDTETIPPIGKIELEPQTVESTKIGNCEEELPKKPVGREGDKIRGDKGDVLPSQFRDRTGKSSP